MADPTNLYQYFTSKGQKLPTVAERRKNYGLDEKYVGTAEQNAQLLKRLKEISGAESAKPASAVSPLQSVVTGETKTAPSEEAPTTKPLKEELTGRLNAAITGATPGATQVIGGPATRTLREEKQAMETEKGVPKLKEAVGSFEDEIAKTQTLLDQLEEDITKRTRDYLVSEPQRRRILATEQEPLIKQLSTLERGYGAATSRLERTSSDILTELGLIEKEKTTPLDLLEREVRIRSDIKNLTDQKIPNIATSQFNDEGDLTIVMQDPETGAISTQMMKGIGKKAEKYQNVSSHTDDAGNVTIIGITRGGKAETIGTIRGVAKTERPPQPTETEKSQGAKKDMNAELQSVTGTDGYVSPTDWRIAKKAWTDKGLLPEDFIKQFYGYINPSHPKDYGEREENYLKGSTAGGPAFIITPDAIKGVIESGD